LSFELRDQLQKTLGDAYAWSANSAAAPSDRRAKTAFAVDAGGEAATVTATRNERQI